jgi:ATP-dependent exoDNAse (exonuclease V) beta subunit
MGLYHICSPGEKDEKEKCSSSSEPAEEVRISLIDGEGKRAVCLIADSIEYNGKSYVVLKKENDGEKDAVIFRVVCKENGEKQYTSADRGIATHVFMQFCDFKSLKENGVEYELKALVDKQFISEETMKLVSLSDIEAFRQSELLSELLSAKRVMREFRFNVMLPVGNLSKDPDLQNKEVLVQGVTDCIYENDRGELVLVDYKTDRVTLKNYENELRERHSTQLEYYKRACEMIFERPLKKAIIYSVPLAKTVEI